MIHTQRHKNIPFFIPHSGCKNNCVFCSQTKITGFYLPEGEMHEEAKRLKTTVEDALLNMNGAECQIAFFGGSFTGIEKERMVLLLETAYSYVKSQSVSGIRISTRPDYINEEILSILKKYGVTDIELGLQSTNEQVLEASGRGHSKKVCFDSAKMIVENGFIFGGQMMIGLPKSSLEAEIQTAKDIVAMGAKSVRIYPTVVFEGTVLYDMTVEGKYTPINNEEAAYRSAECLKIFIDAGVEVLRIGLHASEELAKAPFGANHPAMGELVYSSLAYDEICKQVKNKETQGLYLHIYSPINKVSAVVGHGGENRKKLLVNYGFKSVKIHQTTGNKITANIKAED